MLKRTKPKKCKAPEEAFAALEEIYNQQTAYIQEKFAAFSTGGLLKGERVRGCYPYVRIVSEVARRADTRHSYGFVPRPGSYSTTVTRPDIFREYLLEQFRLLTKNHDVAIEVGLSDTPIPLHFALGEDYHPEAKLTVEKVGDVANIFDVPDLDHIDDEIANGTYHVPDGEDKPLALFTAARVDMSLQRLRHYCGTSPSDFQHYVIFTNYQFYIDEFVEHCRALMRSENTRGYTGFVEPTGGQMPAYHLQREGGEGITMVNIGVGPSNAKTITDHIAVLRPHAWIMLGHCAGLRNSQRLGDYVLAHAYLREDHILDGDLPLSIPLPALSEIQNSLQMAVADVTGYEDYDLKNIMRTGTVATTDDRNWEARKKNRQLNLSQSRAIAMDMESGTIAANGFRFRVPYGTLLCISDRPLHGELKLPGMANSFYETQKVQHLQVGLRAMELLRDYGPEKLHSRKLRSFDEVAFR